MEKLKANENKENDETLAMWALERGYIERAIDAYARAHKLVAAKKPEDTANKPEFTSRFKLFMKAVSKEGRLGCLSCIFDEQTVD